MARLIFKLNFIKSHDKDTAIIAIKDGKYKNDFFTSFLIIHLGIIQIYALLVINIV